MKCSKRKLPDILFFSRPFKTLAYEPIVAGMIFFSGVEMILSQLLLSSKLISATSIYSIRWFRLRHIAFAKFTCYSIEWAPQIVCANQLAFATFFGWEIVHVQKSIVARSQHNGLLFQFGDDTLVPSSGLIQLHTCKCTILRQHITNRTR